METRMQDLQLAVKDLNTLVARAGKGSVLDGLTVLAIALAVLLDRYALPNPENPEGMCYDPVAFRRDFAGVMVHTPGAGQCLCDEDPTVLNKTGETKDALN